MKHVDYIVVGAGLAGILFCEKLLKHNKTFVVFDDGSQRSSTVAGGLYNPVVLKRFSEVWNAKEQLQRLSVYNQLEQKLAVTLDYKLPVYRLFASVEEQNNWFQASDKLELSEFLSPEIVNTKIEGIKSPFGFGKVLKTGRIDTEKLIMSYRSFLKREDKLVETSFQYNQINLQKNEIEYQSIVAMKIVFAEGFGLKKNPYFNHLPLNGTKGELLTIKAPELKLNVVVKSGVFIIPLGAQMFRVGATYEWTDKSNKPTEEARRELSRKLDKILECDYDVMEQVAGIRPTVIDRRPLVGRHQEHSGLFVLNGLGTRGVMLAPYAAEQLYDFIEKEIPLDEQLSIDRFT